MALITCPDCEKSVSDAAPNCPGCGRPMAPTEVEQTAKRYKATMAASFIGALLAFAVTAVLFGMGKPIWPAFSLGLIALVIYLAAIVSAWWRNG